MGLFRPYEQGKTEQGRAARRSGGATEARLAGGPAATETVEDPSLDQAATASRQPRKKGTRTPTRAEAEAARMARLHPQLSPKEAKRAEREAARDARLRNLDAVENTKERRLARDHVDARWTITEFTIPLMLVIMAISLAGGRHQAVVTGTSLAMLGLFALWILNIVVVWRGYTRLLAERGLVKQRGIMMYIINRMMTLRALRRPQPAIARGESY
ncbi:DUF3043 domain-containing protein [Luteococcus peritonei]|uniref:DUF3043 domain-containing protein n=1 Tax=Luteococcus peritonei TaxID=88874 RepID=A0ABW4RRA4_9ACTN